MAKSLKTGDKVVVISGGYKGQSGKIVKVDKKANKAMIEGIGVRDRHVAKNYLNPNGSKRSVHLGIHISNLRKEGEK